MNAAPQPRAALTAARVEGFLAAAGDPVAVVRETETDLRVVDLVRSPIQRDDSDDSTLVVNTWVVKLGLAAQSRSQCHRQTPDHRTDPGGSVSVPFCLRLRATLCLISLTRSAKYREGTVRFMNRNLTQHHIS